MSLYEEGRHEMHIIDGYCPIQYRCKICMDEVRERHLDDDWGDDNE